MPKFIDQELFNMIAVTVLKISTTSDESLASVSESVTKNYSRTYQDSNLCNEIIDSAEKIESFLTEALPEGSLRSACTQMQYCIKNFKSDGSKKRKKILNGAWFSGENQEIENKVGRCAAIIITYHLLVVGGKIPIAPKGWSI